MRSALTLVTPPSLDPITVSEAQAWVRLDDDESILEQLIGVATSAAEQWLRRSLLTQTWKLTIDPCGSSLDSFLGDGTYDLPSTILTGGLPRAIGLPRGPIQSISSVVTYDTAASATTFSASNYYLSSARLILSYGASWPSNLRPVGACDITYLAGYGSTPSSVPQPIKTGILIHVANLYEQRGQCDDPMEVPAPCLNLYRPYRLMGDNFG